jgi:3-hydroxyacyl-CoA dehydrogenase
MSFTKITTAGAGTMGSQVAWQMAFHGKHVTVYPDPAYAQPAFI